MKGQAKLYKSEIPFRKLQSFLLPIHPTVISLGYRHHQTQRPGVVQSLLSILNPARCRSLITLFQSFKMVRIAITALLARK
jgi:hypothetical protein